MVYGEWTITVKAKDIESHFFCSISCYHVFLFGKSIRASALSRNNFKTNRFRDRLICALLHYIKILVSKMFTCTKFTCTNYIYVMTFRSF